jgi:hypothetical protein
MTPLAQRPDRAQYRSPRHCAGLPLGGGRRSLGHRHGAASMGRRGLIRKPAPAAGTNKTSPPPIASRTAENRRPGCLAYTSQASSLDARVTGQNGRGSAKQAVPRTAPSARTLSAYLHRRGDGKWFLVGPVYGLGRASLCSLALIAAGRCERAAGSGGAERPHGGAAGALDAAARERIMGRRGQGSELGSAVSGLAWGLSCRGPGDLLHDGTGGGQGTARLT